MRAKNRLQSLLAVFQADRRPMYLQLMEQIRHWIAVADWLPEARTAVDTRTCG